jgi:hypothetical protein
MEDVGIFYGHSVHFTVVCYISWTFGIVGGNLVYFSRFGILYQEKSGHPGFVHLTCSDKPTFEAKRDSRITKSMRKNLASY